VRLLIAAGLIITITVGVCLTVLLGEMSRDATPSRLRVHLPKGSWESVTFCDLGGIEITPRGRQNDLAVSEPMYYGPHVFEVVLANRRSCYFEYFLTDAGRVAGADIYLSGYDGKHSIHAVCITRRRPVQFGGAGTDFSGIVDLDKATGQGPWWLKGV